MKKLIIVIVVLLGVLLPPQEPCMQEATLVPRVRLTSTPKRSEVIVFRVIGDNGEILKQEVRQ